MLLPDLAIWDLYIHFHLTVTRIFIIYPLFHALDLSPEKAEMYLLYVYCYILSGGINRSNCSLSILTFYSQIFDSISIFFLFPFT